MRNPPAPRNSQAWVKTFPELEEREDAIAEMLVNGPFRKCVLHSFCDLSAIRNIGDYAFASRVWQALRVEMKGRILKWEDRVPRKALNQAVSAFKEYEKYVLGCIGDKRKLSKGPRP